MAKITYDDKVNTSTSTLPNINKFRADDANEIKRIVNTNDDELQASKQQDFITGGNPVKCGYKIDGHDVYVKRIDFGPLPNKSSKVIASGIDFNNATLVKLEGIAKYSTNNIAFTIPFANPSTLEYSIMLNVDNSNNVVITTGSNRSDYNGVVTIYFYYNS